MVGQLYKDIKIAWQVFLLLGFIFTAQVIVTIEAYNNPQAELESFLFLGIAILNFFSPYVAILPVIQAPPFYLAASKPMYRENICLCF